MKSEYTSIWKEEVMILYRVPYLKLKKMTKMIL